MLVLVEYYSVNKTLSFEIEIYISTREIVGVYRQQQKHNKNNNRWDAKSAHLSKTE